MCLPLQSAVEEAFSCLALSFTRVLQLQHHLQGRNTRGVYQYQSNGWLFLVVSGGARQLHGYDLTSKSSSIEMKEGCARLNPLQHAVKFFGASSRTKRLRCFRRFYHTMSNKAHTSRKAYYEPGAYLPVGQRP